MYIAVYIDSMIDHLSLPFLVPWCKFLGDEYTRELSVLVCVRISNYVSHIDYSCSTDSAVFGIGEISVWSVCAQKQLCCISSPSEVYSHRCVAISANGGLIFSGHDDGTVLLWDAGSSEPVGVRVEAHSKWVSCLAISKDGSTIVTGSRDKTLRVWNAKNGEPKGIPMYHEDEVYCVAICESESMIVSGSEDGTVCRWNMETCAMVGDPMCGHKDWVASIAVDENGKMTVSGSMDGTLIRLDAKTGKQTGEPICSRSSCVSAVAISPCGKMIVSGSYDSTVRMWDAVNGKQMGEPFRRHYESVYFVGFTEESGGIISGSMDGTIRRWNTANSLRINESTRSCEGNVTKIVLAKDGRKVVASYENGTLLQWDARNGMTIGKPMKGRLGKVVSIAINEKCGWILAAYSPLFYEDTVILWDSSTCEMVGKPILVNLRSSLTSAAVSSNGKMIVTGSRDGTLQRYCAITGEAKGEMMLGHKKPVTSVAFSPNDEIIVSRTDSNSAMAGSNDEFIIRWVSAIGEQIGNPLLHDKYSTRFSISDDGAVIVSASRLHGLCRWDTISGQLIDKSVIGQWHGHDIWTNYDGTKTASWESNGTITRWSVEPGGAIHETSRLLLSNDVVQCDTDMNNDVAALASSNEAVGVSDIHR